MAEEPSLVELISRLTTKFTVEDYLELRRRSPDSDTPFWMVMTGDNASPSFGLDFAFQLKSELAEFDIQDNMLLGTLDGDRYYVDFLCVKLLEALAQRKILKGKGGTQLVARRLAIGDALVDFLIGTVLESIAYYKLELPHSFQILLKYRLGLFQNEISKERILKNRRVAVALIVAENPGLSARNIARRVGLNPSTIVRWLEDDEFVSYVNMFRAHPPRETP